MIKPKTGSERAKYAASRHAAKMVKNGMKVGLGTGSTAAWLVRCLAERVKNEQLSFVGVPTSEETAQLASELGLNLSTLDEVGHLDLTIDGTDEVNNAFELIKGGGGALLREKIVAKASAEMIVIADPSKNVEALGQFPLPVDVIPFGRGATLAAIESLLEQSGYKDVQVVLRKRDAQVFVTDEGNNIFDLHLKMITNASDLACELNLIPGVVENGLFVDMCRQTIIGHESGIVMIRRMAGGKVVTEQTDEITNLFSDIGEL